MRTVAPYLLVEVELPKSQSSLILDNQIPELGVIRATSNSSELKAGNTVLFGSEIEEINIFGEEDTKMYLMKESNIKLILGEETF